MGQPILMEVIDGGFAYQQDGAVFSRVNLQLARGHSFTIIGPNGAGKSTLLRCLAGLSPLQQGRLLLQGAELHQLPRVAVAKKIGFVPQSLEAVFAYSVMDFVVMGRAPYISNFRQPSALDFQQAANVLKRLGIAHLADKPFTELSGGEQQQASIARVLLQDPAIILLDEPTSALDFGNQLKVIRLVKELTAKGYAVVMTTHNPDHAIMLADQVGVMDRQGRLSVGNYQEVIKQDRLSKIYQVDVEISYVPEIGRKACLAKL